MTKLILKLVRIIKKYFKKIKMNKGQKLLKKAKKIIPGGNLTFSKRAELLPELWPILQKS